MQDENTPRKWRGKRRPVERSEVAGGKRGMTKKNLTKASWPDIRPGRVQHDYTNDTEKGREHSKQCERRKWIEQCNMTGQTSRDNNKKTSWTRWHDQAIKKNQHTRNEKFDMTRKMKRKDTQRERSAQKQSQTYPKIKSTEASLSKIPTTHHDPNLRYRCYHPQMLPYLTSKIMYIQIHGPHST